MHVCALTLYVFVFVIECRLCSHCEPFDFTVLVFVMCSYVACLFIRIVSIYTFSVCIALLCVLFPFLFNSLFVLPFPSFSLARYNWINSVPASNEFTQYYTMPCKNGCIVYCTRTSKPLLSIWEKKTFCQFVFWREER